VKCAVVIPVYRHEEPLVEVLRALAPHGLDCFLVDDGNKSPLMETLPAEFSAASWVSVLRLPENSGKGAACVSGARAALERGFTHAIFLDADGQHNTDDLPRVLALARAHPHAMIMGRPVFDVSAPWSRRRGRLMSNIWVWIETLSLDIQDSLCGFRCFPLDDLLRVAEGVRLGKGMDFDPDIAVRLYWRGLPVVNFDTQINYPPNGISNFDTLRDNVLLSRLHARLFFGMLRRASFLWMRRQRSAL
jgi:glycosyltransferase involved in cell wall biosynthesis